MAPSNTRAEKSSDIVILEPSTAVPARPTFLKYLPSLANKHPCFKCGATGHWVKDCPMTPVFHTYVPKKTQPGYKESKFMELVERLESGVSQLDDPRNGFSKPFISNLKLFSVAQRQFTDFNSRFSDCTSQNQLFRRIREATNRIRRKRRPPSSNFPIVLSSSSPAVIELDF